MSNRILGISASLRAARFGTGGDRLVEEILELRDAKALLTYLRAQTGILLHEFFEAGRLQGKPFTDLYYALRKAKGERGLCNSEAALTAGLWGASQCGSLISYCALANHFPPTGGIRQAGTLRRRICAADAILLSGPVYFGDRGSLAQRFFEFLHADPICRRHVRDKVFAGIAVGAKRNGGQETTLIYQILDATNLNMLAVGNGHETTAQYGGTAVAGDVGTFPDDQYGLTTSISTGRRLSLASSLLRDGMRASRKLKTRIGVWLLQDDKLGRGLSYVNRLCGEISAEIDDIEFDVIDLTQEEVYACIACEVCPTDVGAPIDYRCIVRQKDDLFFKFHKRLIGVDAILLAAYSPRDRGSVRSIYQTFVERTRYLRRDDYQLGDRLIAPLVISEVGANQNLHIRMLTSAIRHLSILHHPLIGFEHNGEILNEEDLFRQGKQFAEIAKIVTRGRAASGTRNRETTYNPVGYIISAEKKRSDVVEGRVAEMAKNRRDFRAKKIRESEVK